MGKDKKEDVDLSNEENKGGFGTYIDDDQLFSDSMSLRRRLSIIEKVLIILIAAATIPFTSYLGKFINPDFFNPFDGATFVKTLPPYILSFVVVIYIELATKNVSITKGLLKSTLSSLILSLACNETSFALIVPFENVNASYADELKNYMSLGIIATLVYALLLFMIRLVLVLVNRSNKKYAIIVGPRSDAEKLARRMISDDKKKLSIRYIFYEENGNVSDRIYSKVKKVNTIILMDSLSSKSKEKFLLYFNSSLNKDVYVCTSYYDIILLSNSPTSIGGKFSFEQKPLTIDRVEEGIKRIGDIVLAILALALTLPIWVIVPMLIKIDSRGPVFYRQIRLTKNLREFKIFKFRSMVWNADPNRPAEKDDKRITRIGHFLRATRIDELPQILNVIKGDMSFVGPRAFMHGDVDQHLKDNPEFKYRFNVLAGVTGYQQVKTKPGDDYNDKLCYDLYYIANHSLSLDFLIIFRTIGVVFQKGMAEGVDDSKENFPDFLMEQGILSHIHWDYRSLFYSKSVDKSKQTLLKETLEMTMEMKSTDAKGKTEVKTWMPKGSNDDVGDGKD